MDAFRMCRKRSRDGEFCRTCKNPGCENRAGISDVRVIKRHCGDQSSNLGESTEGFEQCLVRLPNDLQLKILEYISAVDIAMVGCVCKELRIRAADEELWKKHSKDKFGVVGESWERKYGKWKDIYVTLGLIERISSTFFRIDLEQKNMFKGSPPYSWRFP
ncbi:hypothetical protein SUGI_0238590 [Cryptomeria japonica]|nr:hypothetical protein SUGI_0238590 [Cryptomeria japonica]